MRSKYSFSGAMVSWFVFGGAALCVATIVMVAIMTSAMGVAMSLHGWIALIIGTIMSFALGLGLTAILVWGRRNGFDEGAHEAASRTLPD